MRLREIRRFALHYVEMVVAMLVGMMVLFPLWMLLVTAGVDDGSIMRSVEVDTLAMATTMAVPMADWMRFRGHGWAPTLEMSAAMYAGIVLSYPFHWAGGLGEEGVMVVGHVLMLVLMVVAMLWRWQEYAGRHADHRSTEATRPTMSGS